MPQATFNVTVEVPSLDPAILEQVSTQIEDELAPILPVIEVSPWARHESSDMALPGLTNPQSLAAQFLNPNSGNAP